MRKKNYLFYILFLINIFVLTSCYTTKEFDVYENAEIPYNEIHYRTEYDPIPPIIDRDNLVIAFTKFGGTDIQTTERVSEALRLGFLSENKSSQENDITFISRGELLNKINESVLYDLGEDTIKQLQNKFDINIIGTGIIMEDTSTYKKISFEIFDLQTDETYNKIYTGSNWERIGVDIAKDFFGTHLKSKQVPYQITKYKTERFVIGTEKRRVYDQKASDTAGAIALIILSALALVIGIGASVN